MPPVPTATYPYYGVPATPFPPTQATPTSPVVTLQDLVDLLTTSRKDPLPQWKLSQFDGDPMNWPEWFGQYKSAIDSAKLTDDVKLTYLKTLVTGKAKSTIASYGYSGALYKDALKALERKFGQPHTIVSAYQDKLNTFPPVKMHNSEHIINFSTTISSMVGVFKSLGFDADLQETAFLNQA